MPMKFYEYTEAGIIVCEDCLKEDLRKTEAGEYTEDEAITPGMYEPAETPAQCDGCLTQSDDYDDEE